MTLTRQLFFDSTLTKPAINLLSLLIRGRDTVILCIGSDKMVGDSLGPLCGHYLKNYFDTPCYVYGCLDYPVHALNLKQIHQHITTFHKKSLVIAVDSMIGNKESIGKCKLIYGSIFPGSADGKILPHCGDISLTAIIADKIVPENLNTIRLGQINKLAMTLATTINGAICKSKNIEINSLQNKTIQLSKKLVQI